LCIVVVARHRMSILRYFRDTVVIIRDELNQPMLIKKRVKLG